MVTEKTRLPVVLEVPGMTIQSTEWNGMAALYVRLSAGADFTPVLKGLADDLCSCPHWGYVTKGAIYLKYKDGSEEIARAGDLWHTPPGHTAWCIEDSEFIEFSPQHELATLLDHVRKQVQGSLS
jgi:hypothetical protein